MPDRYGRFNDRMGFDDPLEGYTPPIQQAQTPSSKPKLTAAERREKAAAKKRSEAAQAGAQVKARKQWEQSPEGQKRLHGVEKEYPGYKAGMVYLLKEWGQQTGVHPRHYDRQLPGLEDPYAAAQNKRWEDHTPKEQADIERRVKLRSGATLESMTEAYGAQLDQAYMRAEKEGWDSPRGADFYSTGEPRQVIRRTAQEMGVPQGLVAALHADNSPNSPFVVRSQETGTAVYPQDQMARAAIAHAKSGEPAWEISRPDGAQGYQQNLQKSAQRAHQVLNEGRTVAETRAAPGGYREGKSGFGPKTSPYLNSFLPSTPSFFVSDVHSGGGGMLPHLSYEKPIKRDAQGNPIRKTEKVPGAKKATRETYVRDKSEREKVIGVKGYHAMADKASRDAHIARGLGEVRQGQAAQWNEEREQRGLASASEVPSSPPINKKQFPGPGQGSLF